MKCAPILLTLCSLVALPGCASLDDDMGPLNYLSNVRIVRVIPAPWYSGVTATLAKIEAVDQGEELQVVYVWDVTDAELDRVPVAGEVCTVAYRPHVAIFGWVTGDGENVQKGQRILMGEYAVCGAKSYSFPSAFRAR